MGHGETSEGSAGKGTGGTGGLWKRRGFYPLCPHVVCVPFPVPLSVKSKFLEPLLAVRHCQA